MTQNRMVSATEVEVRVVLSPYVYLGKVSEEDFKKVTDSISRLHMLLVSSRRELEQIKRDSNKREL